MESTFPQTASTALINISLVWMAGILASRIWLMKLSAPWHRFALCRLRRAMTMSLAAGIAGTFLSLWSESAAMGDVPWLAAWPAFTKMLTSTHYGHAGIAELALLAIALVVHWRLAGVQNMWRYVGTLAALFAAVAAARVTIGHAYEHGPFSAPVAVEWLHILFMSLWAGAVYVSGWRVLPCVLAGETAATAERTQYLASLSRWATVALLGILATGAYNTFRVLGSPHDLVGADYGRVLVFKLVCVVVAIALGGFNRFVGLPAASAAPAKHQNPQRDLQTVIRILRIESFALSLALVAAAVLTNSAPPGS